MRGLTAAVVGRAGLPPETVEGMFALFGAYYRDVAFERFRSDLAGKDAVVLLTDGGGELRGFSTLAVSTHEVDGSAVRIVFSGDTIIDRPFWGSPVFSQAWVRLVGRLAAQAPGTPLFWLLIAKGHRTFRFLPAFARDFVPNWTGGNRPRLVRIRDAVAGKMFGDAFDAASGIVRSAEPRGRLAAEWACPSPREAGRADVSFFLRSNPGHAGGDELACLCELSEANMRPMTLRLFRQGFETAQAEPWTAGTG